MEIHGQAGYKEELKKVEKIKLQDGQGFEIIPMGIKTTSKTIEFTFISCLSYEKIEEAFNPKNINEIEYFSAANELLKIYKSCTKLKILSKKFGLKYEDGKSADVFSVELELS